MASPQETDLILLVGRTLTVDKRFVAGICTLWFYDYFLMISDEIKYGWSGRTSLSASFPQISSFGEIVPTVPQFLCCSSWCDKTAWFSTFYFTFATLFAQVAITLRIYAVTGNSRWIASCLYFMTLVQFAFGIYLAIWFALRPALQVPDLPFDEYKVCFFHRWRTGEIIYIVLSLAYDASAFLLVIYSARHRGHTRAHGVPSLLDKIVQDATVYFLVIFGGHLLLIFFELFAPAPIQLLPASGNAVLIPLMVTRLILSLRKAATSPQSLWSSSDIAQMESVGFADHTIGGTGRRDRGILLRHLSFERSSSARSCDQD
ncbi:hypothetical protein BDM02DRAFT_3191081 [Thelephora ganbajun]|uniref:Uncharacterized protein n=1 Tax=Thelephora ganbajun TaxID=370292 RepID=A0ACB6Z357_THEGA|nr:hypothetical protein BDM02DRAFT_3191081 [Thelephora ganbajun]